MPEINITQPKPRVQNVHLVLTTVKVCNLSVLNNKHLMAEITISDSELRNIIEVFGADRILDYIGTKAINEFLK